MDDTTNLNPPAVVKELAQAAATLGFTMSSNLLTGSLLRTLVASKPAGEILELGTGVGMGTAWLLSLPSNSKVFIMSTEANSLEGIKTL